MAVRSRDTTADADRGRPAARPPDPARSWRAEIEWRAAAWRSRFCVVAQPAGSDGERIAIAASEPLRWPPSDRSALEAMTAAVQDLEERLVAAGWMATDRGEHWYAKRFAWEAEQAPTPAVEEQHPEPNGALPAAADEEPAVPAPEPAAETADLWRCEIAWDAGFVTSRFVALGSAPGKTDRRPVGSSAPLKWLFMDDPDPRSAEVEASVRTLEAALVKAGWERAGRGTGWYALRFVWRHPEAPPRHVDAAPVAAVRPARTLWRCEIGWQTGYRGSRFVAVAYEPGQRRGRRIAASAPLKRLFRDDPDPRVAAHPRAVQSLAAALVDAGWEPAGEGPDWYARRFVWRRDGDPPRSLEPAASERD